MQIELHYLPVGHTRNTLDALFGDENRLIKKVNLKTAQEMWEFLRTCHQLQEMQFPSSWAEGYDPLGTSEAEKV